jgi:replicative DNA helicase
MTILADGMPEYVLMAEELLVGGVLVTGERQFVTSLGVQPTDFRDQTLGVIWKAISNAVDAGHEPLIPAVAYQLDKLGWLDKVGAEPRLVELSGKTFDNLLACTPCGVQGNAEIVRDWSARRRAIREASEVAQAAYEGGIKRASVTSIRPIYDRPEYQGLAEAV